jgi:hypothetical protein
MFIRSVPVFISLLLSVIVVSAQDKCPVRFGHVAPEDFDISKFNIDSSANGVIIADVGSTTFEANSNGGFSIVYKHQRRLKIINRNGFELADVNIPLYVKDGKGEELEGLKAITYNLEDGKVIETKLSNSAVFDVKEDKYYSSKKFTLPAVKEGSIIEYSYTIRSYYVFHLYPWDFQGTYPRVWSEYETDIPEYYKYVFLTQGYEPFYKKIDFIHNESYTLHSGSNTNTLNGNATDYKWIMRNVPALKEEKFTTSIGNHIAKIDFQLASVQFPADYLHNYMGSWEGTSDDLLKSDDFGNALDNDNNWLNDDMKLITANSSTDIDKAKSIYYYVKNNIKCTDQNGIWLTKPIKQTFKDKNGSVADINLLLVAILRHEKLTADPIILSTTSNGYTNEIYPLISKFNYVVCQLSIANTTYFLDATKSYLGFGHLPQNCYNGHARVINKSADPVYFRADTLSESSVTTANLHYEADKWVGTIKSDCGYYGSCAIREVVNSKNKEAYETALKSIYADEATVSKIKYKDLDSCEKPMEVDYNIAIDVDTASVIYFNPMLKDGHQENYFKSAQRKYPVEMPYKTDETYILNIDIPKGYQVDDLPQSVRVTLKDGEAGYFEYIVSQTETSISLRSHLKLEQAFFSPKDYQDLRDFFDYVVKKHSEQFVFKKKTK